MKKLVSLLVLAGLGYLVYRLLQGGRSMMETQEQGSSDLARALNEDAGRAPLTGPARGETVTTEEPSGESVPHVVGRGVVRPG